ncbi:MAG: hypothetical protein HYU64_18430 [Armatimonadetes bacterium]|nr:hypothetical protein [Armatimonadota bacterium]
MSIYRGIRKRWIEGDYAGSYRPGEEGSEIRSQFFRKHLGRDNLRVKNAGYTPSGVPRPLVIATDLLVGVLDSSGNQVSGKSDGLYYPYLPNPDDNEPTLKPLTMLLERVKEERLLAVFSGDQHENPQLFDMNALTTTILDPDLTRLSARERAIVEARFLPWVGKRLPAGLWREIFMDRTSENPRGELIGKETRNFLPHCTEGIVEYLGPVQEMFKIEKDLIHKQTEEGILVPEARWFPVAKDGLTVDMPPDERGTGGNKLDELLKAAFTGGYFQGDDHRHQKRAIVVGACYEYSVRLLIEHLIDADINVICLASCTKGLDLFSSKAHTAHYLKELYGKKLFFTYDWPEPLLGPKPKGWDQAAASVKARDQAQHAGWFKSYQDQLRAGKTSMGQPVFLAADDLVKTARTY